MYKDKSERRTITKQTGVHPTVYEDILSYLEGVDFKLTDLVVYAVESYMSEGEHPYDIDPHYCAGVPPYEGREARISYRLRPAEWETMKDYASAHGKNMGSLVYQSLLSWLYIGKRLKKK